MVSTRNHVHGVLATVNNLALRFGLRQQWLQLYGRILSWSRSEYNNEEGIMVAAKFTTCCWPLFCGKFIFSVIFKPPLTQDLASRDRTIRRKRQLRVASHVFKTVFFHCSSFSLYRSGIENRSFSSFVLAINTAGITCVRLRLRCGDLMATRRFSLSLSLSLSLSHHPLSLSHWVCDFKEKKIFCAAL